MKLSQIFDAKIDKSEIETKYLWMFNAEDINNSSTRIDLSTFIADNIPKIIAGSILQTMSLPNNLFFGHMTHDDDEVFHQLFISDENLNIHLIDHFIMHDGFPYKYTSCFYNDSIYVFESGRFWIENKKINHRSRKYSMKSHKWVILASPPFMQDIFPIEALSCIGINQKIVIASYYPKIWLYDIILNSFSENFLIKVKVYEKYTDQMLIENNGKIYLLVNSVNKEIFYCNGPMEKWTILGSFKKNIDCYNPMVWYRGLFYYHENDKLIIYQFSLDKFQPKAIKIGDKVSQKSKLSSFIKSLFK